MSRFWQTLVVLVAIGANRDDLSRWEAVFYAAVLLWFLSGLRAACKREDAAATPPRTLT